MSFNEAQYQPDAGEALKIAHAFHSLNELVPEDQELLRFPRDKKACDAIEIMSQKGYSQVPVVVGDRVFGLFSYRSYSQTIIEIFGESSKDRAELQNLEVGDCLEDPVYAHIHEEFSKWFDYLDERDAILLGDPSKLLGIVTPMDILRYLYEVAHPFVLIAEFELTLRALMRSSVNNETLQQCAKHSLQRDKGEIPLSLEDMTFHDYIRIIGSRENWQHFQKALGGTRTRTITRLEEVRELRNRAFHFRHFPSQEDYDRLAEHRNWILRQAGMFEEEMKKVEDGVGNE